MEAEKSQNLWVADWRLRRVDSIVKLQSSGPRTDGVSSIQKAGSLRTQRELMF